MRSCDFSQASLGATPTAMHKGVRPLKCSDGIYATDEDRVEEGTEEAVDPVERSNGAEEELTGNAEVNQPDSADWIPAYPGEYGEYSDEEAEETKGIHKPSRPTEQEVEEHCRSGHVQFRSWCEIWIKARRQEKPHFKRS